MLVNDDRAVENILNAIIFGLQQLYHYTQSGFILIVFVGFFFVPTSKHMEMFPVFSDYFGLCCAIIMHLSCHSLYSQQCQLCLTPPLSLLFHRNTPSSEPKHTHTHTPHFIVALSHRNISFTSESDAHTYTVDLVSLSWNNTFDTNFSRTQVLYCASFRSFPKSK